METDTEKCRDKQVDRQTKKQSETTLFSEKGNRVKRNEERGQFTKAVLDLQSGGLTLAIGHIHPGFFKGRREMCREMSKHETQFP